MTEFTVRVATPADTDRLLPLLDEMAGEKTGTRPPQNLEQIERRRAVLAASLLDFERPVVVAYSGMRVVGCLLLPDTTPFVSASWRGLGVDIELLQFLR
ncbi:MAG TPA: hypothetical protein VGP24_00535 [Glaciihabitans sp.]|jgi:hypothetical protein|nr:hypothetical protein [Glaciihabitans sp.]